MTGWSLLSSPCFNTYSYVIHGLERLANTRALGVVDSRDRLVEMVMVLFVIFKSLLCTCGLKRGQACFY